eukprot:COSAG04_NODE_4898_length_1835_cov_2.555300_2_plen_159_part_00
MTRGVRAVVRAGEPIVTFSARVDLHTTRKPISAKGMGKSRQRVGAYRLPSPLRVRWSVSAAGVPSSISGGATCRTRFVSKQSQAVWLHCGPHVERLLDVVLPHHVHLRLAHLQPWAHVGHDYLPCAARGSCTAGHTCAFIEEKLDVLAVRFAMPRLRA